MSKTFASHTPASHPLPVPPRALRGLWAVGRAYLPRGGGLPTFADIAHVSTACDVLGRLAPEDRQEVLLLLGLLGHLPQPVVRLFVRIVSAYDQFPWPLRSWVRLIHLGLKGLVMTLYYSDPSVRAAIGWNTKLSRTPEPSHPSQRPKEDLPMDHSKAFARARRGAARCASLTVRQRLRFVATLRQVILRHQERIVGQIQHETGKARTDALLAEILATLDHMVFLEKNAERILADRSVHTPLLLLGKRSRIFYEPLGVVLVISPWNYPFLLTMIPTLEAFVAGNAILAKPSEFTPLTGLIESLFREAGMDPDVFQSIEGDGTTGAALIAQRPDKIFFTGSVATGKKIMAQAAESLIPVCLELGGKDPMIVLDDANPVRAAAGAVWGAFTNTGQACTSIERVYVQAGIYDAFRHEVIAQVTNMTQGIDAAGQSDMGRMCTKPQVEIVRRHLEDAERMGGKILTGSSWDRTSPFIPPTVVELASDECLLMRDETFGPILPLRRFVKEEEAIALANSSPYGLGAAVFTADLIRGERIARALVTGNVSINNIMVTEGNAYLPFGGVKNSGIGRSKGEYGLLGFCNIKSVMIDKNSSKIEANWFPYTEQKYRLLTTLVQSYFRGGVLSFARFLATALRLETYANRAGHARSAAQGATTPVKRTP